MVGSKYWTYAFITATCYHSSQKAPLSRRDIRGGCRHTYGEERLLGRFAGQLQDQWFLSWSQVATIGQMANVFTWIKFLTESHDDIWFFLSNKFSLHSMKSTGSSKHHSLPRSPCQEQPVRLRSKNELLCGKIWIVMREVKYVVDAAATTVTNLQNGRVCHSKVWQHQQQDLRVYSRANKNQNPFGKKRHQILSCWPAQSASQWVWFSAGFFQNAAEWRA